jgi:hypothetical protein
LKSDTFVSRHSARDTDWWNHQVSMEGYNKQQLNLQSRGAEVDRVQSVQKTQKCTHQSECLERIISAIWIAILWSTTHARNSAHVGLFRLSVCGMITGNVCSSSCHLSSIEHDFRRRGRQVIVTRIGPPAPARALPAPPQLTRPGSSEAQFQTSTLSVASRH